MEMPPPTLLLGRRIATAFALHPVPLKQGFYGLVDDATIFVDANHVFVYVKMLDCEPNVVLYFQADAVKGLRGSCSLLVDGAWRKVWHPDELPAECFDKLGTINDLMDGALPWVLSDADGWTMFGVELERRFRRRLAGPLPVDTSLAS